MKKTSIAFLLLTSLLLVGSLVSAQAPASPNIVKPAESSALRGKNNRSIHQTRPIGFSHISSIGAVFLDGGSVGVRAFRSIQTINGVRLGKQFSTGIGIGYERSLFGTQVPIFAHARYSLLKGAWSPYLDGMAGYSVIGNHLKYAFDKEYEDALGGITIGIGGGVKLMASQRFGLTIGMGYRHQRMVREYEDPWWDNGGFIFVPPVPGQKDLHSVEFRIGILFN